MRVVIVDVDQDFANKITDVIRASGHEPTACRSPEEARQLLAGIEDPYIVLTEHDFGPGERGYDLCRWLREEHNYGLVLPVVYLTASEAIACFLQRQARDPFHHPSAFIAKCQVAQDPSLLPRLLAEYKRRFDQVRALCEKQTVRQAVYGLARTPPEVAVYVL